jgi:hypothetical protein
MIKFHKYALTSFDLEKMEDLKFDGEHPNGFNPGYKIKGATINLELSIKYQALFVHDGPDRWFHTSTVERQEECEGYDLLYTLNSVYKVTPNIPGISGVQEKHIVTIQDVIDDINNGPKD